jgi:hypothetical protein
MSVASRQCSVASNTDHATEETTATSSRQRAFCFACGGISVGMVAERQPETRLKQVSRQCSVASNADKLTEAGLLATDH